jgi:hypothetical protein
MNDIEKKIKIFRRLFAGLPHAYGTYDPNPGRSAQMKAAVTDKVFANHIKGKQPFGVYLLVHDKTRAVVVDFVDQVNCAFNKNYRGYGCSSKAVAPFCHSKCPIRLRKNRI